MNESRSMCHFVKNITISLFDETWVLSKKNQKALEIKLTSESKYASAVFLNILCSVFAMSDKQFREALYIYE